MEKEKEERADEFLLKCMLFYVLSKATQCKSYYDEEGRFHRNEFCLDTTNGRTIADDKVQKLKMNEQEKKLLSLWEKVLKEAKKTDNYDPKMTYGVYQIMTELDTFDEGNKKYDYPALHNSLTRLNKKVKEYYDDEILPIFLEYSVLQYIINRKK